MERRRAPQPRARRDTNISGRAAPAAAGLVIAAVVLRDGRRCGDRISLDDCAGEHHGIGISTPHASRPLPILRRATARDFHRVGACSK